ncbi:2-hydroxyacid dehydrogenase [Saccharibacter floricola]|uniref:D-isomer-specific 2-hydroxyacid dehydrogenase n=1 Tax=Saccharibacter floricola DSM 15669 TaxID=1123227 RepID=A0ABQ0P0F6_9PROT|nr:2-hydroxyacid dehydrogenase [Saccharibacter floricola]GBQ08231.1 D-isomer-specific 2-hydroxyacid dehydrogenase [Saccharibacter floricola DSM 15669]
MPTRPYLLLLEPLPDQTETTLAQHFTLHRFTTLADLTPIAPSIRAVATGGSYGIDPEVMATLPALEIIAVNGVGLDRVDLTEARRRQIRVTVTTDISTSDVADSAMLLLLTLKRNFTENQAYLRSGQWATNGMPPSAHSLTGLKLGVAGFGRIGQAIARRAEASDMKVAYFNRTQREKSSLPFFAELKDLAQWSDVLVVSLPAVPGTQNLINADILNALGPTGVLINIARGSIVDEKALIHALNNGIIAGAGLDVFQNEPNINPEFFTLENTVVQPHQGSATVETRSKMGKNIIDNLLAHFEGRPLLTPVI